MKFEIALSTLLTLLSIQLTFPAFASSSAVDTTAALRRTDDVSMNHSAHNLDAVNNKLDEIARTDLAQAPGKNLQSLQEPQGVQATEELRATPMLAGHCSIWHQFDLMGKS